MQWQYRRGWAQGTRREEHSPLGTTLGSFDNESRYRLVSLARKGICWRGVGLLLRFKEEIKTWARQDNSRGHCGNLSGGALAGSPHSLQPLFFSGPCSREKFSTGLSFGRDPTPEPSDWTRRRGWCCQKWPPPAGAGAAGAARTRAAVARAGAEEPRAWFS